MSDALKPSAALLAKVGSIVVHLDEALSKDQHHFDWEALRSLLADDEVTAWLAAMSKLALVPVQRHSSSTKSKSLKKGQNHDY